MGVYLPNMPALSFFFFFKETLDLFMRVLLSVFVDYCASAINVITL